MTQSDVYPEDYVETVEQARRERGSRFEPPLLASVPAMARYSRIFLGFLIWGEIAPHHPIVSAPTDQLDHVCRSPLTALL